MTLSCSKSVRVNCIDGWVDGSHAILRSVLVNSILVISELCAGDNQKLCAMELRL